MDRRDFIKSAAATAACASAGIALPSSMAAAQNTAEKGWRWDKAACRFCNQRGQNRSRQRRPGSARKPRFKLHQGLF